ncbi:hypothetical protein ABZW50_07805 [Streptomyces bacillaris]
MTTTRTAPLRGRPRLTARTAPLRGRPTLTARTVRARTALPEGRG